MKKYSGYSLIELMVALAVLAVLLSAGLPRLSIFFKGNRMVTNANEMVAGLHVARSEAIKRGSRVSICKSTNAGDANPTCSKDATGWETGWIVFVEGRESGNAIGEYGGTDNPILRVNTGAEGNNVTIKTSNTGIGNYVSFTSRGTPKLASGNTQSGVFMVCDDRGFKNAAGSVIARGIVLNASGRVRVTNDEARIKACQ